MTCRPLYAYNARFTGIANRTVLTMADKGTLYIISAPSGAGKTSLAKRLAMTFGYDLLLEQADDNPFLTRFYQDPARYALQTELFFLFQRADQLRQIQQLERAKEQLSEYLYDNADALMNNATSKLDYRKAYDDFVYLNQINPGFENSKELMEMAYEKGVHYVKVGVVNQTRQIIPERLEQDLLNFNTYGLDELWTKYHTNPQSEITYDYDMNIAFRNINVSPEQVNEKQIIKEKQIKDGYRYATDTNGAIVKDSLGNKIRVDKFKTVRCDFYQFTQFKAAQVDGAVHFVDLQTKQEINSYPISSEFIFEHVYANYDGDRRALDNELVSLLNLAAVPFPTNEQMVFDAGEDLKTRIKYILKRQRFN